MSSVVVRAAIDGQRLIADIVLVYPVWKDFNNGQVTVTGVGIYDESEDFIAPVDFNARYDDDGYDKPRADEVLLERKDPIQGRYGFAMHAACWALLEEGMGPANTVPVKRVFQILDSLPERLGLFQLDCGIGSGANEACLPWEPCLPLQSPGGPPSSSEPTAPAATDVRRNDDTARGARANRDHIVERVKALVDIVRLHHEVQELVSPWNEASEADDKRWRMVAGSLECSTNEIIYPHHVGCRELFHNTISVPEDISQVSVSNIRDGQFWTQFGGPDGAYLEHLTRVSFYDSSRLVLSMTATIFRLSIHHLGGR
ncbi:uncharacterized protein QC763_0087190 [Podospora pseudopauciseta]|uniref:Uncharacterized protein n=1 Tax=Podospora pseudopauciseta TaxID=2093780 RepID=A0ABR0H9K1_9PEZI|nr:hypothetical protein QC763_0087190 [Podospora pseudopauciseta]